MVTSSSAWVRSDASMHLAIKLSRRYSTRRIIATSSATRNTASSSVSKAGQRTAHNDDQSIEAR